MAFTSLGSEFDSENWVASYRQRPASVKGQNWDKNSQVNDEALVVFWVKLWYYSHPLDVQ